MIKNPYQIIRNIDEIIIGSADVVFNKSVKNKSHKKPNKVWTEPPKLKIVDILIPLLILIFLVLMVFIIKDRIKPKAELLDPPRFLSVIDYSQYSCPPVLDWEQCKKRIDLAVMNGFDVEEYLLSVYNMLNK